MEYFMQYSLTTLLYHINNNIIKRFPYLSQKLKGSVLSAQ